METIVDLRAAIAFWDWPRSMLGAVHTYVALAAVVLGPVIFLRRKGDLGHRLLGLVYVFAMLFTNVSALMIYDFTGGPNIFHLFAIISLATAIPGVAFAVIYGVRKSPGALAAHIDLMSWSYFGLVMAAIAESLTRGLGPQIDSYRTFWIFFGIIVFVASVIGNFVTVRLIRKVKARWLPTTD